VLDVVIDRLLELQVDEGIPVHVIPIRPPERAAEMMPSEADLEAHYRAVAELLP